MPRTRPAYPAEYKAELVRLVREEGRTPASLAKEFEPTGVWPASGRNVAVDLTEGAD